MAVKGLIVFDLDGTLVDQAGAVARWVREFTTAQGIAADDEPAIIAALTARAPKDRVFRRLVAEHGLSDDPARLWDAYRRCIPDLVRCFEGVPEALTALRSAGWTIGIASNGMADNQVGKIRRTGLAELVDGWVVSSEIGVRKPDPAIVHALAAEVGTPVAGWMIGDGVESDIECGRRAGLRTVWISGDSHDGPSPLADLTAASVPAATAEILRRSV